MDMDITIKGIALTEENIIKIGKDIFSLDVQDGIDFVFEGITEIRERDKYENYRISFSAHYGRINNPMKMDVTTGDAITLKEMAMRIKSLLKITIKPPVFDMPILSREGVYQLLVVKFI